MTKLEEMAKIQMTGMVRSVVGIRALVMRFILFRYSKLLRISNFGFRISQ
jgi:hypothetical protein